MRPNKDLRTFLKAAREAGPEFYVEVQRPLSPEMEVSALQEKLAAEGRFPVIYCPRIKGSQLPLVTDLFGNYELLGLALGLEPRKASRSQIFQEYRRRIANPRPVKEVPSSRAPVKEVILKGKDIDLGQLPIPLQAEFNSGKYISAGQFVCKHPDTGVPNVAVCRHEVKGKSKLGAHLAPNTHSAYIARRHAELGREMEAVIFLGHHPSLFFASTWHGEMGTDEMELMGGLLGEPVRVTPAETVGLMVPAQAELAIEGVIDPRVQVTDGPYSELMGYYGEVHPCYLMQVTAITRRQDAIYHELDPAHREHTMSALLGNQAAVYDAVKAVVPSVKEVYLPPSGHNWLIAYVSLSKRVSGEGVRAGVAAVNSQHGVKIAVAVDEDIDVYREEEVLWAVATRSQPDRNITIIPRTMGLALDPTAYDEDGTGHGNLTSKMVIDATMPTGRPFARRVTPPRGQWESINLKDYLK